MAHWIIDDHGFGGSYYKCSECGTGYWDILEDVCGEDSCPNCGSPINEDDNVYMRDGKIENDLPYTHNKELNDIVTDIMNGWYSLVKKAKSHGIEIKFAPDCTKPLELYFHDDYPNMILVDKETSCEAENTRYMPYPYC